MSQLIRMRLLSKRICQVSLFTLFNLSLSTSRMHFLMQQIRRVIRHIYMKRARFGLNAADTAAIDQAAAQAGLKLKKERKGKQTLCLGTGELMYVPMRLAAHMGEGVLFHSTTRSPIHPVEKDGYAVQNGFTFVSPEDARIQHYVYNIPKDQYDDVFLFFEKKVSQEALRPLVHLFAERHVKHVHIVTLSDEVKVNG